MVLGAVRGTRLRREDVTAGLAPTFLLLKPRSFSAGSTGNQIRLIGDRFPAQVTTAHVSAGPAVTVRRIVSSTPGEIVAKLDVAQDASPGKRNIAFRSSTLEHGVAIYDRIDWSRSSPTLCWRSLATTRTFEAVDSSKPWAINGAFDGRKARIDVRKKRQRPHG